MPAEGTSLVRFLFAYERKTAAWWCLAGVTDEGREGAWHGPAASMEMAKKWQAAGAGGSFESKFRVNRLACAC